MKPPPFVHLSPTVPATLIAAIGLSLSAFLLLDIGAPREPTPLFAAIGGVAGRVAAGLPATATKPISERVGNATPSAQVVNTRSERFVAQRRPAPATAHHVHRRARTRVVQPASPVPVQVAAPSAPAPPVPTTRHTPRTANGKAHSHRRALKPIHQPPALASPPRAHGGPPPPHDGSGNGHKGGKR
jgi:hypothetical protein